MKFLVLVLFLFVNLVAKDDYSFRVGYGLATKSDFFEVLYGDWKASPITSSVVSVDAGYLLEDGLFDLPLDIYAEGGLHYITDSSGRQGNIIYDSQNVYEGVLYLKAYWNFDFWKNRVRVGFGEGVSYTGAVLNVEKYEADSEQDNNSNFLNYIDFSVDFDLGKLIASKELEDVYIGWSLQHRSGIFGTINNVKHGGSNYNAFYVEAHF